MVLRFFLSGRGDPMAAMKAGALTLVFYYVLTSIPEERKIKWIHWLQEDPNAPFMVAGLALGFMLFYVLFVFRTMLWSRATFRSFPRVVRGQHTGCVLWLHGVGDNGAGFGWLRDELSTPQGHVTVALPDAPRRPIKAAEGQKIRAWFDISKLPVTLDEPHNEAALLLAVAQVHMWIDQQAALGIPPSRLVLGGFSQGAALAAWAAATCKHRLAAVVLWSGYAPRAEQLEAALKDGVNGTGTPFVLVHGDKDGKVLPACGEQLAIALAGAGVDVRSKKLYAGLGHGCTPEQLQALKDLVAERLAPTASKEPAAAAAGGGQGGAAAAAGGQGGVAAQGEPANRAAGSTKKKKPKAE